MDPSSIFRDMQYNLYLLMECSDTLVEQQLLIRSPLEVGRVVDTTLCSALPVSPSQPRL